MTLIWTVEWILGESLKPKIKGKTKMYILGLILNRNRPQQLYAEKTARDLFFHVIPPFRPRPTGKVSSLAGESERAL